jgi:hypothetical protein
MLGRVDYADTFAAMKQFTLSRTPDTPDALWICEHAPVFTQGIAGRQDHILDPGDIPVVQTDRGGQVTFHGPGQVVVYPLIDLRRGGYFVKEYVYRIEESVLRTLAHFGVTGHRVASAPGIYVRLDDPFSHAALTGPQPARPVPRPRQDRRAGHQGEPPCHLPRRGAERRHGPRTLLAHQPLRLRGAANGRSFYNRHPNHMGRSCQVLSQKLTTYLAP